MRSEKDVKRLLSIEIEALKRAESDDDADAIIDKIDMIAWILDISEKELSDMLKK